MTLRIGSVVEGHGEVQALPILIRRIAADLGIFNCDIRTPHRIGRDHMTGPKVARAVRVQQAAVGADGLVIVLYDSDDDVPESAVASTRAQLAPESDRVLVFTAVREFEAWFLAGIDSLRGAGSVADDASFDGDPEAPRDAAGRLEELMTESYKKTLHQARFTGRLDFHHAAKRSPSLLKFVEGVSEALRSTS